MKKNQQKTTETVLFRRLFENLWRYFTPKNTTYFMELYLPEQKENKTTPRKHGIICLYPKTHRIVAIHHRSKQVIHKLSTGSPLLCTD